MNTDGQYVAPKTFVSAYTIPAFQALNSLEGQIAAWQECAAAATVLKDRALEMRKTIASREFDTTKRGTQKKTLESGEELKTVIKHNFNLGARPEVEAALEKLPKHKADRLVKWKPELSLSEYKLLDDDEKKIIDAVLTTSEGAHTLEVKPPKK